MKVNARFVTSQELREQFNQRDAGLKEREQVTAEKLKKKEAETTAQLCQIENDALHRTFTGRISAYKKGDLRALAKALSLSSDGKNAELLSRIQAHFDTNQDVQENPRYSGLFIHGSQKKACMDRDADHSDNRQQTLPIRPPTNHMIGTRFTRTATMSNIPTVFEPKGTFASLLTCIKEYNPNARKLDITPHLKSFLADPTVKKLLDDSEAPANAATPIPSAPGDEIQATLKSLSQAIISIQKKLATPQKQQPDPSTVKCGKGPITMPPKLYSAITSSRPLNPSLVVDLAHLNLAAEDRPKPEIIY